MVKIRAPNVNAKSSLPLSPKLNDNELFVFLGWDQTQRALNAIKAVKTPR
jgi:hypothetical protein